MQLRTLKESQINQELEVAIRQTLCICFPQDRQILSQTRAWHGAVASFTVLIEQAQAVIAHLCVVDRVVKVGTERLRVAGVGNVCVLPEYRGKGLSDWMLKTAMAEAGKANFDCGLLFTAHPVKKVYARNGWQELTAVTVIRIENGQQILIPEKSVKMFYPLKRRKFPPGVIHLQGNDW